MTRPTPLERFMAKVEKTETCWIWTGATSHGGYGKVKVGGSLVGTHRWIYTELVGSIPDGLTLDHLCHTADLTCAGGAACGHRLCVNPDHLEPVTAAENNRRAALRKTSCPSGHEYTAENTVLDAEGYRQCRTCRADQARDRWARVGSARQAARKRAANPLDFAIREWAQQNGLPCAMRGAIPFAIRDAYADAHSPLADSA